MRFSLSLLVLASITLPLLPQQPRSPSVQPQGVNQSPQSQEPQPQKPDQLDVVRISTNLVQIDAVVVNRDGKQVIDLTADDFEIFEDGKKQVITNFSYVANVPSSIPSDSTKDKNNRRNSSAYVAPAIRPEDPRRTMALVVDDLGISTESLGPVKQQLRKFIDEQITPNDLIAIIRTGGDVGALQQFTTDKRLLHRAVDNLRRHPCSRMGATVLPVLGSHFLSECSSQALSRSTRAIRFIVQSMGQLAGRKSMVLFSDSLPLRVSTDLPEALTDGALDVPLSRDPNDGTTTAADDLYSHYDIHAALKSVTELAIRSSVVIYSVDTRGVQPTGLTAADSFSSSIGLMDQLRQGRTIMSNRSALMFHQRAGGEMVARETGGFAVRSSNDFRLPRIMSDQEGYYLIGYQPGNETFDRRFHHIKAKVKRRGLTVRTRQGFFGLTDEATRAFERTNPERIGLALMSPFESDDVDIKLTTLFSSPDANSSQLHTFIYFQARDLSFTELADGWRQARFDLSAVIFGDDGTVINQASETRTLRLRGDSYKRAISDGLVYRLEMPVAKPGLYKFRVAIRDVNSSLLGTAGQFVEVPQLNKRRLTLSGITVSGLVDSNLMEPAVRTADAEPIVDPASLSNGPAQRRFRTSSNLYFGYVIYNARIDKVTQQPKLMASLRILQDTKLIFEGAPKLIDLAGQSNFTRITAGGGLQLGTDMPVGEYLLEITVTDITTAEQKRTSTQWIDFEIVK